MASYHKKGAVTGAVGALVALVVGVAVVTLILIFTSALSGQTFNLIEPDLNAVGTATVISGDTFTAINATAVSLDHGSINPASLQIFNSTSNLQTNGTAYTVNYVTGAVTLRDVSQNNTLFSASYTYDDPAVRDSVKTSILNGFSTMKTTSQYLPIVVLAVIISIVLVLVLSFTEMGGSHSGGSAL